MGSPTTSTEDFTDACSGSALEGHPRAIRRERGPRSQQGTAHLANHWPNQRPRLARRLRVDQHIFREASVTAQRKELHTRVRRLLPRHSSSSDLATITSIRPRGRPAEQAFASESHAAQERAEARTQGNCQPRTGSGPTLPEASAHRKAPGVPRSPDRSKADRRNKVEMPSRCAK